MEEYTYKSVTYVFNSHLVIMCFHEVKTLFTFKPVFILVSALQLRSVLQVLQQVSQDFTPLGRILFKEEPLRRFNEASSMLVRAQ